MSRQYRTDKEYSFVEIVRYNLKMWWLAVLLAVLCAAALGGYKYVTLKPYVENEMYDNKLQVHAALFVSDYSDTSVVERVGNVIKIAKSSRGYQRFCEITGYPITIDEYNALFEAIQGEASGVVSIYVTFPVTVGNATLPDENVALEFTQGILQAAEEVSEEVIGADCVSVLDEPYVTQEIVKMQSYSISEDDFKRSIMKAVTAGVLLGIIVEIVLYTFWMLIYRKPKNAEEIRECMDANIIDVLKSGEDNEEAFKKVALYLRDEERSCNRIGCIRLHCPKKDAALKLAMSYANEQKKTLYVDLSSSEGAGTEENSVTDYVLGQADAVHPLQMNAYLDSLCRSRSKENGMDIAGNRRFAQLLDEMDEKYDCIVINSANAAKGAEAYAAAKLCNKNFVVCGRKSVKNETLYRAKNTADVNDIRIDGVLVYEL